MKRLHDGARALRRRCPTLSTSARYLTLALGAFSSACSFLYDFAADQCETTADCASLGGQFSDRVCMEGICQAVVQTGCDSNAECLDDPANFGPTACINRECTALTSEECPVVLPVTDDLWIDNLRTDDPLIWGGFAFIPDELIGNQIRNYDLALTEFTEAIGGLPGVGTARRQLLMVVCHNNVDQLAADTGRTPDQVLEASMDHLVDTVGVPGIVSALLADDLQLVYQAKPNTFFMSPLESDSTLTTFSDGGLIWHILPGGESLAGSYAPLLNRALTYLNLTEPARVALVTADDVRLLADIGLTVRGNPADGGILFNGKSAIDNLNDDGNFLSLTVTSVYADPTADLTSQIQDILAFRPHVIIAAAADEFLASMVPLIESNWSAEAGSQPPPFYLLSPFHFNNPALPPLLQSSPNLRLRLVGVNAPSAENQEAYDDYQIAFDDAYREVAGTRGFENFYDAAYYLIYAAAGARNLLTGGPDMTRGMANLLSGPAFGVGKRNMSEAMAALGRSAITLNGTLGPPNFNVDTGGRTDPGSVWCINQFQLQQSDVLRNNNGTLEGTFPASCIPDF